MIKNDKEYKSGITLITPTVNRPVAFSRCEEYGRRQKRRPDQWIVVDGGSRPVEVHLGQDYVKTKYTSLRGTSIARNYLAALPLIKYDKILFFEDDDWYREDYIQYVEENFKSHLIVGFFRNRYYNVRDRFYFVNGNFGHSSLATTAIKSDLLPEFYSVAKKHGAKNWKFIDLKLWARKIPNKKLFKTNKLYIGIKGLPGTPGMAGHIYKKKYIRDLKSDKLRQWLREYPEDYEFYTRLL